MNCVGVVLAAGLGTRLRPSTDHCPKPLIPVAGVEPLYHALLQFERLGIHRVVVNAHYLVESVQEALLAWKPHFPKMETRVSVEKPEILGTGGALIKIVQENSDWFQNAGLLLQNGDTLSSIDMSRLMGDSCRFAVSMKEEHLKRYNPLWIDKSERHFVGIGKQAPSPQAQAAHFLGIHYLSPTATEHLKRASEFPIRFVDLFNGVYRPLMDRGIRLQSVEYFDTLSKDFWFDMTTAEFLLEAQRHVLERLVQDGTGVSSVTAPNWAGTLRHRYPHISCFAPGVWSTEAPNAQLRFQAPAVFVQATGSSLMARKIASIRVGPHASLVHHHGHFAWDPTQQSCKVENSVVFSVRGVQMPLESALENSIFVL